MKLYHWPNTRSGRIVWMLEECGANYEIERLDISGGGPANERLRKLNPMCKLPVLEDRTIVITESPAICAYLADLYPEKQLAPEVGDPLRGLYYRWMFLATGVIEPAFLQKGMGWETRNAGAAGWGDPARVFEMLKQEIPDDGWLVDDHFTAADLMIGGGLNYMMMFGMLDPWPAATTYVQRCLDRPAYQRALEKAA